MPVKAQCPGSLSAEFPPVLAAPSSYSLQQALDECRDYCLATRQGTTPNTFKSHARVLGKVWPGLALADFTKRHVQTWIGLCKPVHSAQTINHRLTFLKMACDLAVESELIARNPVQDVKRLPVRSTLVRDITRDEEATLSAFIADPEAWEVVRFAMLTGLRRAEQFRLLVEHVDFEKQGLRVKGSKGTRWRWVPLNEEALKIARACAARGGPWLFSPDVPGCRVRAGRLFYQAFFHKAVKDSGLPRTRWIDLRHSFASRIVQGGKSLFVLQSLLGHQDPKTTLVYAHLQDGQLRDAVSVL